MTHAFCEDSAPSHMNAFNHARFYRVPATTSVFAAAAVDTHTGLAAISASDTGSDIATSTTARIAPPPSSTALLTDSNNMRTHDLGVLLHTDTARTSDSSSTTPNSSPPATAEATPTLTAHSFRLRGDDGRFMQSFSDDLQSSTKIPRVPKICGWCRTSSTPQWRLGPTTGSTGTFSPVIYITASSSFCHPHTVARVHGSKDASMRTLCNKCGINFRRTLRKTAPGSLNLDRLSGQTARTNKSIHKAAKHYLKRHSTTATTVTTTSSTSTLLMTPRSVRRAPRLVVTNHDDSVASIATSSKTNARIDCDPEFSQRSFDAPYDRHRSDHTSATGTTSVAALCLPSDIPVHKPNGDSLPLHNSFHKSPHIYNINYCSPIAPTNDVHVPNEHTNSTSLLRTSSDNEGEADADSRIGGATIAPSSCNMESTYMQVQLHASQPPITIASLIASPPLLEQTSHAFQHVSNTHCVTPPTTSPATNLTSLSHCQRLVTAPPAPQATVAAPVKYTPPYAERVAPVYPRMVLTTSCSMRRSNIRNGFECENRTEIRSTPSKPIFQSRIPQQWCLPPFRSLIGQLQRNVSPP